MIPVESVHHVARPACRARRAHGETAPPVARSVRRGCHVDASVRWSSRGWLFATRMSRTTTNSFRCRASLPRQRSSARLAVRTLSPRRALLAQHDALARPGHRLRPWLRARSLSSWSGCTEAVGEGCPRAMCDALRRRRPGDRDYVAPGPSGGTTSSRHYLVRWCTVG